MKTKTNACAGGLAQHTPGPWKLDGLTVKGPPRKWPGQDPHYVQCAAAEIVAHVPSQPGCYQEYPLDIAKANARLIAAAPDLLAALKFVLPSIRRANKEDSDWCGDLSKVEAAIAKTVVSP